MSQVFCDVNKQPSLEWHCVNFKEKLGWQVAGEYQILKSPFLKEGLILLGQSILETRRITHLHGSAHFTIPIKLPHCILKTTLAQPHKRKHEIMIHMLFLIHHFCIFWA